MNWRTFRLTADYLKFIRQLFILSNAERQCRILVSGTTPFRVPYSPMFRPSSSSSFLASSSGQSVAERRRVRTLVAYAPLFTVTCVTSDGNLLTKKTKLYTTRAPAPVLFPATCWRDLEQSSGRLPDRKKKRSCAEVGWIGWGILYTYIERIENEAAGASATERNG